ncbi:hypothetical protein AVO44_08390 [Ruegeria profundi]|uniref:Transporter n=2 Tax=Ruegeria profundi TaxID=1685378 RepID=A0A0X3TV35_9RHOB|nr:hypothetical protein AVO44_08390 [Ruegeria profundi]
MAQSANPSGSTIPDGSSGPAQDEASDLAKQLSNPVASLITVPFQFNYDTNIGETDADRWVLNIQPVIPFDLTESLNLISRTIVPFIDLDSPVFGGDDVSGLGDIVQSFFFSPKAPTANGWIWGAGPVFLLPTGKDEFTSDNWGVGPTAVALKQDNGWTYGALINHIWGVDNPSGGRDKTNATFLQPFLSYTTPDAWTYSVNTESTYDWNDEQWTIPINASVSKLVHFGDQPVSFQFGGRYYADAPSGGPDWGLRFNITFLFPE